MVRQLERVVRWEGVAAARVRVKKGTTWRGCILMCDESERFGVLRGLVHGFGSRVDWKVELDHRLVM